MTYLVHGEEKSASALGRRLEEDLGWRTTVPAPGESVSV
jgi:hypothetical protein